MVSKLKELAKKLDRTPTLIEFSEIASKRQIQKHKYSELCKMAGLEVNKHAQQSDPVEVIIRPPKILALDIETAPILAHVWGLWENNVALNQIQRDWFVLSFCAKFIGEEIVHYKDQRKCRDVTNDKQVIKAIHKLISEADILLSHNGDRFDLKKLNSRFIYYGLEPIPPKQSIDTLKIAKKFFSFTSNKLEYLATHLKCTPKKKHEKFSGFSMWSECLKGNKEAFEEMEKYNIQDVETLIEVYNKLVVWDSSINFQTYMQETVCVCGNKHFYKNGLRYTRSGAFQIYRCSNCSKCFIGKENIVDKDIRKGLFK